MLNYAVDTNHGLVREKNEDSYCIIKNSLGHYAFVVADGMGGHKAGEVASKIASNLVEKSFKKIDKAIDYNVYVKNVIVKANEQIYSKSLFKEEYQNMGTTISLMIIAENRLYIGHVGDSRIYFVNSKKIQQITSDHTLVELMIKNGNLTREEAEHSTYKNVLVQALGTNRQLTIEMKEMILPTHYTFFLCSDGISDKFKTEKLHEFLKSGLSLKKRAEQIMEYGLLVDGRDNITFIIVEQE